MSAVWQDSNDVGCTRERGGPIQRYVMTRRLQTPKHIVIGQNGRGYKNASSDEFSDVRGGKDVSVYHKSKHQPLRLESRTHPPQGGQRSKRPGGGSQRALTTLNT